MSDTNEKETEVWVRAESSGTRTHSGRVSDSISGSIALDGAVYVDFNEDQRFVFLHLSISPGVEPGRIRHLTPEVSDGVTRLVTALRKAQGTDLAGLRKKRAQELRMELAELEKTDAAPDRLWCVDCGVNAPEDGSNLCPPCQAKMEATE